MNATELKSKGIKIFQTKKIDVDGVMINYAETGRGDRFAENMGAVVNYASDHGGIAATAEPMPRALSLSHLSSSSSSSSVIQRSTNLK